MKKRLLYNWALILLLLVNSTVLMAQWTPQNTGFTTANRAISQISIVDANTVWATAVNGNDGTGVSDFTRTTDGGTTWTPGTFDFASSADYYLTNLHAMSATTAFAAMPPKGANGGVIAKTINGGVNWSIANSPDFSASWLNWVHFFDANNGVCMGDPDPASGEFVIYTTSNGGTSWTKIDGAKIPNAIAAENGQASKYDFVGNSIWFTTGKARVYASSDKGLTWTVSSPGITLTRVKFRTQLDGIAYGAGNPVGAGYGGASYSADLRKTSDGGKTWERLSPTGFYLKTAAKKLFVGELANVPGTTTWFNTAGSTVYNGSSYSFDDGVSYLNIDTTGTNRYTCAKFLDAQTGWAGSFNTSSTVGGIYKWCSVATPTIGSITQPLTPTGTGSVVFNNLPATGTWNIEKVTTSATTTLVTAGSGTTTTVSNLAPGRYRFRVNYGGCLSMVTDEIVISAMTQATNITFTNLSDNSMTVNWTRGTGDKVIVVARRGSAVNTNPGNLVNASTTQYSEYYDDPAFGLGQSVGTLNWTVYNGTGTSVDVIGLLAGVDYHFAVYEYTSSTVGTTINTNYLIPALVGNESTTTILSNGPCSNFNYLAANAQNVSGNYNEVPPGNEIVTASFEDENSIPQDIGFDFEYNCQTFNQFVLNTNGSIKLGTVGTFPYLRPNTLDYFGGTLNGSSAAITNIIHAFNHALSGENGVTEYSMITTGTSPNQICTIQFKDVKERVGSIAAQNDAPVQFSKMNFQIKLYETTNVIEVVYGDFTSSATAIISPSTKFKSVTCGLRGSSFDNFQSLIVNKFDPTLTWDKATFSNTIGQGSGIIFGNTTTNSAYSKPDAGRTFRFVPTPSKDLSVVQIYSMGEASSKLSNAQKIAVKISNIGLDDLVNIDVTLNVSGVSNVTEIKKVTLNAGESTVVSFSDFSATSNGTNTITVSLPSDGNLLNNTKTLTQNVSDYVCNNSTTTDGPKSAYGGTAGGAYFVKYTSSSSHSKVEKVKVFIYDYANNTGKSIQAVVLNDANAKIGESTPYTILATDLGTWKEFTLVSPVVITNGAFYAGITFAAVATGSQGYFPIGVQSESTIRKDAYFSSAENLSLFSEDIASSSVRYMIGATLSEILAPVAGTVGAASSVCTGNTVDLTLSGSTGTIQWQKSVDNGTNWSDISGATSATLTSAALTVATSFRAVVSQVTYPSVNATKVDIVVNSLPTATITGNTSFCEGTSVQLTSSQGSSYEWKNGANVLSGQTAIYTATAAGSYTVKVTDGNGCFKVSDAKVVSVTTNVAPHFDPVAVCSGGTPSISKTSTNGITGEWTPPFGAITVSTPYLFTVDANQCVTSPTVNFTVTIASPVTPIFATPTAICSGATASLPTFSTTNSTKIDGNWTPPYAPITAETEYTFTATTVGCFTTAKVKVPVNQYVTPIFNAPTAICSGSSALLPTSSITNSTTIDGNWTPPYAPITTATDYTFTATTAGCFNTAKVTVPVNALPTATITAIGNTSFCPGGSVQLTSSTGVSYEWKKDATVLSTTTQTYSPTATGNYSVKVTDGNGCSNVSAAKVVTVLNCAGIEELTLESINAYPNPTVGKLNLFTPIELTNANVQLVDIAGKVVFSSKMNFTKDSSTEFDFNELSNGNYILKVNEYQTKVVINK